MTQANHNVYNLLSDHVKDVIWAFSIEKEKVTYVSPSVKKLLGYSVEEILQIPITQWMPPHSLKIRDELRSQRLPKFMETGEITEFRDEYEFIRKDGSAIWTETTFSYRKDESSGSIEVLGITRDISERKKVTDQLANQVEILQTIFSETAHLQSHEHFDKITLLLSEVFDAHVCIIGLIEGITIRTLSWVLDGNVQENISYDLKGTPCQDALTYQACVVKENVIGRYPQDLMLKDLDVDSYIGVPLFDKDDNYCGVINLIFKHKLENTDFLKSILELLASNISKILDNQQAEKKLRDSEYRLKSIFENMTEGVALNRVIFDDSGDMVDYEIVDVNPAFYKTASYNSDLKVIGSKASELYQMDAQQISEFWHNHKHASETIKSEFESPIDGKHFVVSTTPVLIDHFVTTFFDITERKKAEEALKYSESNLSAVIENSFDIVLSVDTQYRLQTINKTGRTSFSNILGIELEIGDVILESLAPEMATVWKERYDRALSGEQFIVEDSFEHEQISFYSDVSFSPIRKDKEIIGVSVFSRDVTDKKKVEQQVINLEKLQSVGTLAGGIAHDFNNILLGVFANISIVQDILPKGNEAHEFLNESMSAMNRASALTKQLLTFAKGGEPLKSRENIVELVQNIIRFDLSGSSVKPKFHLGNNVWPCEVDKGQIEQVVSNLAINAKQAMAEGGHIQVTIENVIIGKSSEQNLTAGQYVMVKISDEGIGIEPNHLDKIFDPYFSTKDVGTGLGLATVFSIIHKHGGDISVNSKIGEGTQFTFYLPAALQQELGIKHFKKDKIKRTTPHFARILVMDDLDMILKVIKTMLEDEGFEVVTAKEGKEAIAVYKQAFDDRESFDAVVLDLTIPGGMGGKETVKEILKINPEAKALVSSGYANDPVIANYRNYGFKGIITKPFTNTQFIQAIEALLES